MIKSIYYLDLGDDMRATFSAMPMGSFTHVIYAFLLPLDDCTLQFDKDRLIEFVRLMRSDYPHVAVMAAVGGWCDREGSELAPVFSRVTDCQWKAERFANYMSYIAYKYGLDGIDFDWEYPLGHDSESHGFVMQQLRKAMPGKIISMAVSHTGGAYSDESLSACSHVNVMAYDTEGHSTSELGYQCLSYWSNRMPPAKICLGIPLYEWPSLVPISASTDIEPHSERARASSFYGGFFFWAAHLGVDRIDEILRKSTEITEY